MDPTPIRGRARWYHRYTLVGLALCLVLIGWGGWVTSIDAGLAVPDWPTSFGSLDPIATGFEDPANPALRWWMHAPVLAEHGHRLLGALVGLWALGLFLWTLATARHRNIRLLAAAVLMLVMVQGILGGLRVVWVSLDLAVAHALGAQLFFSSIMALATTTSPRWVQAEPVPEVSRPLRLLSVATTLTLFTQILLGALLRHPGAGVHPGFTLTHVAGSMVVLVLIFTLFGRLRKRNLFSGWAWSLMATVGLQMMLGIMALCVLWYEESVGLRSSWQIVLNCAHLVCGTLLLGLSVGVTLHLLRRRN